jgi:eukaryotic-like serine/threonine-protein kinase
VIDFREFQDGELVPGTRYRVARLIGAGGMGRVYEVEHVELGKRFVLKALQRELARREDLVARLRNEWRALARLEHPSIVNVTDAGTSSNGVPFYVMERLEGENLATLLHRARRLLPQQALAIAASVLEGLHAAHQIGVVHRDVKPPNIFLTGPTTVKVLDFGIAKIRDANDVITARGMAVGTPRYMSPEQANGTPVDARSDIYATGLILFEMVSGVGPFDDARDPNELLLAQLGRKAPLLSSISVVAPELDALVAGMLAKDPRERPGDARQVAETLRALATRYERYVGTDVPTISGGNKSSVSVELPTRVEGRRASRSPGAGPATRPDGVAARGPASSDDTTAVQPRLEVATTAVPQSSRAQATQHLPEPQPPVLYGPDTLVDSATSAPTAAPAAERTEHTEMLLAVPPTPSGQAPRDVGVTRTAVPIAEAPNLTPPPVVPTPPVAPKGGRSTKAGGIAITLLFSLVILGGVVALRTSSIPSAPVREPTAEPRPAAAAVEPLRAPAPVPVSAPPTSSSLPATSPVATAGNKTEIMQVEAGRPAKSAALGRAKTAATPPSASAAPSKPPASLPASGL